MKNKILLIVGRTCTGKDTLAHELEKAGYVAVKSYTTRPRRYDGEDTHIFITAKEAASIVDKVATTTINGYEYFATRKQLEQCGLYIIDPNGLYELIRNCPDVEFLVVHVTADFNTSLEKAVIRSSNQHEAEIFKKRYASENTQFAAFEECIAGNDHISDNCHVLYRYKNNFTFEKLNAALDVIIKNLESEELV